MSTVVTVVTVGVVMLSVYDLVTVVVSVNFSVSLTVSDASLKVVSVTGVPGTLSVVTVSVITNTASAVVSLIVSERSTTSTELVTTSVTTGVPYSVSVDPSEYVSVYTGVIVVVSVLGVVIVSV